MTMTLAEIAGLYLSERACTPQHRAAVMRVAARVRTLTRERVNDYVRQRLETAATVTVRTERSIALSLWRFAWERDLVKEAPKGIIKFRSRKKPTQAWTVEQLQAALAATHQFDTSRLRSGASLGKMLRCWMLLGYECGARFGDNWRFTRDNIDGDVIRWVQSKTGDPLSRTLSRPCVDAIAAMLADSPDGRVLGWAAGRRQAMRLMRAHLDRCGLGGTSKWLRRSGATHIEMLTPGKAKLHLGHRSVGLAESAYLDWGQIRKTTPTTPQLVES